MAQTAILPVAKGIAAMNRAQFSGDPSDAHLSRSDPYRSFTILNQRTHLLPRKLRVLGQLALVPAGQPFTSPDPESSVACDQYSSNRAAGKMLPRRRLPWDGPDAIEAEQAEFGAEPEIAVGRLSNCVDDAFGKAVAGLPRGVRVLTDVKRWV